MLIKKFQAKTEDEAITLAKEELGKDAVVMNVKTIKPKGFVKLFRKPFVEITAAVDENRVYATHDGKEETTVTKVEKQEVFQSKKEDLVKNSKDILMENSQEIQGNETFNIENRLNNLQELLEKQMQIKMKEEKNANHEEKNEPKQEENNRKNYIELIKKQLINNEVDEKYVETIIKEMGANIKKDSTLDNVLSNIYQKIILKLGQPQIITGSEAQHKFVFFIGPTGVGKTTTIAKIASNLKVKEKLKIALVTSDTYRIAAVEQLRTYANILGIPLKVIYTPEEIVDIKDELKEFDVVLVDTAGRSHKSKEQREDIQALIEAIPEEEREVYLVLSATTKYNDLIKIAETYSAISKCNLIFTKLDETCSIGNIFNIRMMTNAPLSYATSGQNVPDDIEKMNAQKIAKQLLGGQ